MTYYGRGRDPEQTFALLGLNIGITVEPPFHMGDPLFRPAEPDPEPVLETRLLDGESLELLIETPVMRKQGVQYVSAVLSVEEARRLAEHILAITGKAEP